MDLQDFSWSFEWSTLKNVIGKGFGVKKKIFYFQVVKKCILKNAFFHPKLVSP